MNILKSYQIISQLALAFKENKRLKRSICDKLAIYMSVCALGIKDAFLIDCCAIDQHLALELINLTEAIFHLPKRSIVLVSLCSDFIFVNINILKEKLLIPVENLMLVDISDASPCVCTAYKTIEIFSQIQHDFEVILSMNTSDMHTERHNINKEYVTDDTIFGFPCLAGWLLGYPCIYLYKPEEDASQTCTALSMQPLKKISIQLIFQMKILKDKLQKSEEFIDIKIELLEFTIPIIILEQNEEIKLKLYHFIDMKLTEINSKVALYFDSSSCQVRYEAEDIIQPSLIL
eukprot:gene2549-4978_t